LIHCPLCHCTAHTLYCEHETGEYRLCGECSLVFVLPEARLDEAQEKERYDLHTNSPDDANYRKFLSKVLEPVCERVPKGSFGLDFGSGPGPTLSKMFEENGYEMRIYDHFYAIDEEALKLNYDFITSTEVVEHLYKPSAVIEKLMGMLKPNGLLALLTQPYPTQEEFSKWYYKNDPTHVCFYSPATMKWLAKKYLARLETVGKDIFIFIKEKE
jgi:hypothetical protein